MLRRLSILGVLLVACATARAVPSDASSLVPPSVESQTSAVYPASEGARTSEVHVELLVSLDGEGHVTNVVVATSGGAAFDDAAIAALRQWKFRPAMRGAQAIASRIKVPFHFAASQTPNPNPNPTLTPTPTPTPNPNPNPTPNPTPNLTPNLTLTPTPDPAPPPPAADEKTIEVRVRGNKRPPPRAISDFVRDQAALSIAPHQSASDLLTTAPGVYVSRPEGEAVAHEIFLRGFDAAHGQDMELTLGSVPLNQPSHIHGQGYGDLNFIIPETVRSLRVTEGVYDPRQGDFAVAGSIDFDLGVKERGIRISTSGGSFRTVRQLVLWAPPNQAEETFAAFQLRSTAGFGESRGALSASAIGQYRFNLPNNTYGTVQLVAAGARGNLAGVVRRDDIAQKRVGFYDVYPNPSATSQSAFALRTHAVAQFTHDANDGGKTDWALWLSFSQYRSRENYTGFLERSEQNPDWIGRGELIEQENRDIGIGGELEYKTRRFAPTNKIDGHFALGMKLRTHFIDQAQALLQAPQNETWDRRVDASVRQADIGLYADLDWRFTRYFRVRGGARVDVLYFDIDDRLGNFIPRFGQQTHLIGYRRNALGVAAGPRLTLEGSPREWLQIVAAYGEGFRSPQARLLEEGENAPFAKVRSVEGGLRVRLPQQLGGGDRFTAHVAAFATFLQKDLAFDPGEGRLEVIGPTSRKGVAVSIDSRPLSWLTANVSLTYVHATLDQPPPPTAAVPVPPYRQGQLLPYVPPIVFRADLGVERKLGRIYGQVVDGKLGVGLSALGARPLPYGESSPPIALLDLRASVRWWFLELGVDLMNIANLKYAASEYAFVSDWGTSQNPSYLPARHITAGAPFTAMGTLTLHFGGER